VPQKRTKEKTTGKNRNGIKPLNAPRNIEVRVDNQGSPTSIRVPSSQNETHISVNSSLLISGHTGNNYLVSDGRWIDVSSVLDLWKINDEWWRGSEDEIARLYYRLRLSNGQQTTVYLDLVKNKWFRQAG
jgi:hypothetical protein